jgi:hypothetical protein
MPTTDAALLERFVQLRLRTLLIHGSGDAFASTAAMKHPISLVTG